MPALAGANLIYGLGMIESGMTFDFGQLVMDNEFAGMIKQCVRGIRVDDEALADRRDRRDRSVRRLPQPRPHHGPHARAVAAGLHRPSRPGGLEGERFDHHPGPCPGQGAHDPRDARPRPAAGRRRGASSWRSSAAPSASSAWLTAPGSGEARGRKLDVGLYDLSDSTVRRGLRRELDIGSSPPSPARPGRAVADFSPPAAVVQARRGPPRSGARASWPPVSAWTRPSASSATPSALSGFLTKRRFDN